MGKEVGCTLGESRNMFIGLFLAPTVVAAAVKTAVLTSAVCQNLGYAVTPRWDEKRTDIIQAKMCIRDRALIQMYVLGKLYNPREMAQKAKAELEDVYKRQRWYRTMVWPW